MKGLFNFSFKAKAEFVTMGISRKKLEVYSGTLKMVDTIINKRANNSIMRYASKIDASFYFKVDISLRIDTKNRRRFII